MTKHADDWPDDADGHVFRRLAAAGFDFNQPYSVDYNVDFFGWPPSKEALSILQSLYGELRVYPPNGEGDGYVMFRVIGLLTYEGVVGIQERTSSAMSPFGGACESWGVMHNSA